MILTYRISLEGIKGFFRVYKVNSDSSLYAFHKQIRADLEFALDQPILFKGLDAQGDLVAKYALIDLGFGAVDTIKLSQTIKLGITKFVYFYDVASKKSVNITLEAQEEGSIQNPTLIESKGPLPIDFENGYVAFEDLPEERKPRLRPSSHIDSEDDDLGEDEEDDDDDDDSEEDSDSEEEEIIYDENE